MLAEVAFTCVLALSGGRKVSDKCDDPFIRTVSAAVENASKAFHVPAGIIASVIYRESKYQQFVIGSRGEVGLMQVLRGGAIRY